MVWVYWEGMDSSEPSQGPNGPSCCQDCGRGRCAGSQAKSGSGPGQTEPDQAILWAVPVRTLGQAMALRAIRNECSETLHDQSRISWLQQLVWFYRTYRRGQQPYPQYYLLVRRSDGQRIGYAGWYARPESGQYFPVVGICRAERGQGYGRIGLHFAVEQVRHYLARAGRTGWIVGHPEPWNPAGPALHREWEWVCEDEAGGVWYRWPLDRPAWKASLVEICPC
jgi:hypothetical protein